MFNFLFDGLASVISFYYTYIPNYAVSIILLTITVMVIVSPFTVKSTRSMLAMQKLQPELKKIQAKYKGEPQKLNQEVMAFYKENQVSPLGGCLPMILQAPVFFIMYKVIQGLSVTIHGRPNPQYISHHSLLYFNLMKDHGKIISFGMDLSKSVKQVLHAPILVSLPYFVLVGAVILTQYLMTKQMSARNPQMAGNAQAKMMNLLLPGVFAVISFAIPAGVVVYYLTSNIFRIIQQEWMYRYDPKIKQITQMTSKNVIDVENKTSTKNNSQSGNRRKELNNKSDNNSTKQTPRKSWGAKNENLSKNTIKRSGRKD